MEKVNIPEYWTRWVPESILFIWHLGDRNRIVSGTHFLENADFVKENCYIIYNQG